MLTNKIISYATAFFALIFIPIIPISTIVLGLCVSITFGLLLIPISIIWSCLYFPLLGLSFVWEKYKILRPIASIIGVPIAIVAYIFCGLMPSMGETDSKMAKMFNTQVFPYNWTLFQHLKGTAYPIISGNYRKLLEIMYREKTNNKQMTAYIDNHLLNK